MWYNLSFELPYKSDTVPLPGQFLSIMIPCFSFRKPFAISAFSGNVCSFLYEVKGEGTKYLSQCIPGNTIDVMCFHGNTFPTPLAKDVVVLVGGGTGIGPMIYFAHTLYSLGYTVFFYLGFRNKDSIPYRIIKDCKVDMIICTEDGSEGIKGTVIDILMQDKGRINATVYYFCGPDVMMRIGSSYAHSVGAKAFVSLETIMACSVGACMGCVAPIRRNECNISDKDVFDWKRVCIDGTVFNAKDVMWKKM